MAGRQIVAEFGDGGVGVGELLADRQGGAVLVRRLAGPAGVRQQAADAVDRVAQLPAGQRRSAGGRDQLLLVGAGHAVSGQRLVILADRGQKAPHPRPAGGQRGAGLRRARRRPGEQAFGLPVGGQRLVGLAGRLEEPGDFRQAAADLGLCRGLGPRLGGEFAAHRQDRAVRGQCVRVASHLRGEAGQLEVRRRQRPTRGQVGLLAEQGRELAVEVGGRLQEPVAQLLELLFLEQEVLADAGVERLDRLDGQLVPCLHGGLGAAQFVIGRGQRDVGPGLAAQRLGDLGLGLRLHHHDRRQPHHAGQQRHRRRRHRRPVPLRPAAGAARERLAPRRHRLVGHPPLDVVRQRLRRRSSDPRASAPSPSSRPPPAPCRSTGRAPSEAETSLPRRLGAWHRRRFLPAVACRSAGSRASRRDCRRRNAGRGFRDPLVPAPGSYTPACPCAEPARVSDEPLAEDLGTSVCSTAPGSDRPRTLARPQSTTRVSPCLPTMILAGLMSRWSTPRLCA